MVDFLCGIKKDTDREGNLVVTKTKNKLLALFLSILLLSVAMICGTVSAVVRYMYDDFRGGGSKTD